MSGRVSTWLDDLGLGQYSGAFEENDIGWELLGALDQETLKDIGIGSAGHRLQILNAKKLLQSEPVAATTLESLEHSQPTPESTTWSRTPGELKPVTLLFADIVGSTRLTEKLDAEAAHEVLYHAIQAMCKAVENCNGTVCRFMGDGVMAMFGAPLASERHAAEACRAALDIQADIERYSAELKENYDNGIQIRIGLHSGEVVVLDVGDDPDKPEYDASGPAVPLAARMEQSAKPGTILITAETRNLADDLIETGQPSTVTVKGISEPVITHRLIRMLSAAETTAKSIRRPMVGRKSELAQFRGVLEACVESGQGQTLFIRGDAGIGKTRLVEEMTRLAIAHGYSDHRVLVLDFGTGKGQGALPALVRSLFDVSEDSDRREREKALEQTINDDTVNSSNAVFLNDLLDLPQSPEIKSIYDAMDAQARNEGKRKALVELVSGLATDNAIFIVVEDLHWADQITLDYLAWLANAVADCPALMVFTSRAEGDPIDTNWRARAGEAPIVTWDLRPLRNNESAELVSVFLDANESLAQRCIERAAGNPLFLEQLLLSVRNGASETIPDSIKSLVLSRMDNLPEKDKRALQTASVLGQRFDPGCLGFMIDDQTYNYQNLIDHHLLRPEGTQYLFAHALIREGVYTALIKRQRLELHRKAAEWYAQRDLGLYAEHLDHAEDPGAAIAYLGAASGQAEHHRLDKALQLIKRGQEIAVEAEQFELHYLQGELLGLIGSAQESIEAFRRAAESTDDNLALCRALLGQAKGLVVTEAEIDLDKVLTRAEDIALAATLNAELSQIYNLRGARYFNLRQPEACWEANRKSLAYALKTGLPEIEAKALSGLADAEYTRGHLISAFNYYDQCIEIARKNGLTRIIAANLSMRAIMSFWNNQHDAMQKDIFEARDLASKTHDVRAQMLACLAGKHLASIGYIDEGEALLKQGVDLTGKLGWNNARGLCLTSLSNIARMRGDLAVAREHAQAAIDTLTVSESGRNFMGTTALGALALTLDDSQQALATLKQAETHLNTGSFSYNYSFFENAIELCLQLKEWDEVDRYAGLMEDYTREEPVARGVFFVARGRALAAFGRGDHAPARLAELKQLHADAIRSKLLTAIQLLEIALESV